MKKKFFSVVIAMASLAIHASAQVDFEHAQTRIQEGMSEFFVRPVVAELQMLSTERKEFPAYNVYPGLPLSGINDVMLENAKANAAYQAAKLAKADIILGATFFVKDNKQKKGLDVVVMGYPAKYINFHNYGTNADDSKWISPLQDGARIRALSSDQKQNKAVGGDIRTK